MDFRKHLEQGNDMPAFKESSFDTPANAGQEYFAVANQGSSPACLDLRLAGGNRKALPYSFFTELNFDAEQGIEIFTTTKRIAIYGRNLSRLFDYLTAYRLRYVQANIGSDPSDDGLFVKEIVVEELDL